MARAPGKNKHIEALVKDPASPPRTLLVGGYRGVSAFDGYVRLYLTPTLTQYVDIPDDSLLHHTSMPDDPFGGIYVWIEAGAALLYPGQQPPASEDDAQDDENNDDAESDDSASA
ncbi:MAG: hypothetical protein AAF968_06355 [Pseudomonadota bacterium]